MVADPVDVVALRLAMPRASIVRVQGVLDGLDGLGVLRGGTDGRPELWTPATRADEVRAWVEGLPAAWQVRLVEIVVVKDDRQGEG